MRVQPAAKLEWVCFASDCDARQRVQQKAVILYHTSRYRNAGQPLRDAGAAVNRAQSGDLGSRAPRRRYVMPRRHAPLLLLPLRAVAETPYAKTPYQQWEEDTYYPHSRGGPYQACLKAHLVPKPNTYSGCGLLPKTVKYCMTTFPEETSSENKEQQECLDRYYKWWDCVFDACEETHCSYHGSCPEHPPDVEFPFDDYPEDSTHPEKPDSDYWESLKNQPNIWGDFTED